MTPKDIAEKSKQYAHGLYLPESGYDIINVKDGYIAGATAERESNTYGFAEWIASKGIIHCNKGFGYEGAWHTTEQLFQLFLTTKTTTP